jgi:hypothetical protein
LTSYQTFFPLKIDYPSRQGKIKLQTQVIFSRVLHPHQPTRQKNIEKSIMNSNKKDTYLQTLMFSETTTKSTLIYVLTSLFIFLFFNVQKNTKFHVLSREHFF